MAVFKILMGSNFSSEWLT